MPDTQVKEADLVGDHDGNEEERGEGERGNEQALLRVLCTGVAQVWHGVLGESLVQSLFGEKKKGKKKGKKKRRWKMSNMSGHEDPQGGFKSK